MLKERQGSTPKLDKETAKALEVIRTKALPSINRTLKTPLFAEFDPNRLITKIAVAEEIDIRKKEKTEKPIRQAFPYYDELVQLGVNSKAIENVCYCKPEEMPYYRDVQNPSQLTIPKNFSRFFNGSMASVVNAIITLNMRGAPKPKEIKKTQIKSIAKEMLSDYAQISLTQIILDSGLDPQNPKFDHVKAKILQDLDVETTRIFFVGAQILGALDGQSADDSTFATGVNLHENIITLLAYPILLNTLPELGMNPITANSIKKEVTGKNKELGKIVREEIELDSGQDRVGIEDEDYNILLNLYLKSQIPYIAMTSAK